MRAQKCEGFSSLFILTNECQLLQSEISFTRKESFPKRLYEVASKWRAWCKKAAPDDYPCPHQRGQERISSRLSNKVLLRVRILSFTSSTLKPLSNWETSEKWPYMFFSVELPACTQRSQFWISFHPGRGQPYQSQCSFHHPLLLASALMWAVWSKDCCSVVVYAELRTLKSLWRWQKSHIFAENNLTGFNLGIGNPSLLPSENLHLSS